MLKSILVPLDATPAGEVALPYAEALARRLGATLRLLHVVRDPQQVGGREASIMSMGVEVSSRGLRVESDVRCGDSPATWILAEAELREAGLIVMATHARIGPDRWLHGSVAESVVGRTAVPVLLVRAGLPRCEARFATSNPAFVVPLDGSELAEAALPLAEQLAIGTGGRLVLTGVVPSLSAPELFAQLGAVGVTATADFATSERATQSYLQRIAASLRLNELDAQVEVQLGQPASEIVTTAGRSAAAAIVMATHGRTGLPRTVLGSVAGEVVRHSPTAVIVVRPVELRGAEQALATAIGATMPPVLTQAQPVT
jgi:nucleotide-binding universal stress UspA family protein